MPATTAAPEAKYDGVQPYWKTETPVTAMAGAIMLRHFRASRKLQIIETFTGRNNYRRFGPRAVIDLDDLTASTEARTLLRSLLDAIDGDNS